MGWFGGQDRRLANPKRHCANRGDGNQRQRSTKLLSASVDLYVRPLPEMMRRTIDAQTSILLHKSVVINHGARRVARAARLSLQRDVARGPIFVILWT
jgi:hypothetical protein